jgi:peptide/nickel transport system permease protein
VGRYIVRRILESLPTLLLITMLSFLLLHLAPGGPAQAMLGQKATPQLVAELDKNLGLNKPLYVQYGIWLWQLVHGNLGYAYTYHQTVMSLIGLNLPHTLILVLTAIVISHIVAIALGIFQAYRRNGVADHFIAAVAYFLYSMPTFWLGIVLVSIFALGLNWFPVAGFAPPFDPTPSIGTIVYHLVLPAATLALVTIAGWSRFMRTAMSDALAQDYVRTARAKGTSEIRMLLRHALKNALLPLITLAGLSIPTLFSGALIIEVIFNYPGMGLLFWTAAQDRDYPILLGITVLIGVLTIAGNLLADLAYAWIDPRIKYT